LATTRGFVQWIEIGRAGLARIFLIHADGTTGTYVINDLDGDPERFNERLSKLGILRDAMSRAEPVEIEHSKGEGGETIDRAVRMSRDALAPIKTPLAVSGLVVEVAVHSENGIVDTGEIHDCATVAIVTPDLSVRKCLLNLQAPERLVANAQLEILVAAQASGALVSLLLDDRGTEQWIVTVAANSADAGWGRDAGECLDGYVESLGFVPLPGTVRLPATFAAVRFTTAPAFVGPGNILPLTAFSPTTIGLLVAKGSANYQLFEAGLRDNLRMRVCVRTESTTGKDPGVIIRDPRGDDPHPIKDVPEAASPTAAAPVAPSGAERLTDGHKIDPGVVTHLPDIEIKGLAVAVELLAPLASASRPVWVKISRETLDHGPEGCPCTPGLPSSDLTPMTLRDLKIPYPAMWKGIGCFNEGVYRFQIRVRSPYELYVDGKRLCLFDADERGFKLAYACLHGCNEVVVKLEQWTCDQNLIFDVYRVR
jgi:hypothetical protein